MVPNAKPARPAASSGVSAKKSKASTDAPDVSRANLQAGGGWKAAIAEELGKALEAGTVDAYLDHSLGSDELLANWAAEFESKMPPEKRVKYGVPVPGGDDDTQLITLRPWMLSWKPSAGQSGLAVKEDMVNLIHLILSHGFRTDAFHGSRC